MPSPTKVPPSVAARKVCLHRPPSSRCVATDQSGMSLRAHFQPYATTVQVCGAVDASNGQRLSEYVDGLANPSRGLILDLRGVNFLSDGGLSALVRIVEKSQRTGVRCALVTSQAVDRLLAGAEGRFRLSTAASVQDALRQQVTAPGEYRAMPLASETRKSAEALKPALMHHELSTIPAKQIHRWEEEGGFTPPASTHGASQTHPS